MQLSIKLSANTFKIGDINTESPVRMKTNTPVTLCSLEKQAERKAKLQQLLYLKTEFEVGSFRHHSGQHHRLYNGQS